MHTHGVVKPRTAIYMLLAIVATCLSATATLVALDVSKPVAPATPAAAAEFGPPGSRIVQISGSAAANNGSLIVISGQSSAQGQRVSLQGGATATPGYVAP
jgi:hypothetical protein